MKRHSWPRTFLAHIKFLQPPRGPLLPPHPHPGWRISSHSFGISSRSNLKLFSSSCKQTFHLPRAFRWIQTRLFSTRDNAEWWSWRWGEKRMWSNKIPLKSFSPSHSYKNVVFLLIDFLLRGNFQLSFPPGCRDALAAVWSRNRAWRSPQADVIKFTGFFLSWWIGAIALIARPSGAYDQSRGQRNALFIYSCCQSGAADWMLLLTVHEGLFNKALKKIKYIYFFQTGENSKLARFFSFPFSLMSRRSIIKPPHLNYSYCRGVKPIFTVGHIFIPCKDNCEAVYM